MNQTNLVVGRFKKLIKVIQPLKGQQRTNERMETNARAARFQPLQAGQGDPHEGRKSCLIHFTATACLGDVGAEAFEGAGNGQGQRLSGFHLQFSVVKLQTVDRHDYGVGNAPPLFEVACVRSW